MDTMNFTFSETDAMYQSTLKKVDLPILPSAECQEKLRLTRLGSSFCLHNTFIIFMELLPKCLLNSGHRFCGMELEHTKHFLRLSHHFTAMSTVALLMPIVGVMPLLSHATNVSEVLLQLV
jgi:hypothetical protein